jgi:hypothetical protein
METIEKWMPYFKTSFLVNEDLKEIHRKLEAAKKEIGLGLIKGSAFSFTRIMGRSNAYRIIGKIVPAENGYEISYYIRFHRIIQVLWLIGIPLNLCVFFFGDQFRIFKDWGFPWALELFMQTFFMVVMIWFLYWVIRLEMSATDNRIRDKFGRKKREVSLP